MLLTIAGLVACANQSEPEPVEQATPVEQQEPQPEVRPLDRIELPAYRVLDRTQLLGGGTHGDVLVESFSRQTPVVVTRRQILGRIMAEEGFREAALYCSEEAMRASYSSSYAAAHPGAGERCSLGAFSGGRFDSYENLN